MSDEMPGVASSVNLTSLELADCIVEFSQLSQEVTGGLRAGSRTIQASERTVRDGAQALKQAFQDVVLPGLKERAKATGGAQHWPRGAPICGVRTVMQHSLQKERRCTWCALKGPGTRHACSGALAFCGMPVHVSLSCARAPSSQHSGCGRVCSHSGAYAEQQREPGVHGADQCTACGGRENVPAGDAWRSSGRKGAVSGVWPALSGLRGGTVRLHPGTAQPAMVAA